MPFTVTVAPSSPSTAVPKPIISPYCMQLSKEVVKFIIPDNNRAEEFEVVCPSSPPASITVSIFTFISALDTVTLPVALPVIPPQNRAVFKKPVISMLPVMPDTVTSAFILPAIPPIALCLVADVQVMEIFASIWLIVPPFTPQIPPIKSVLSEEIAILPLLPSSFLYCRRYIRI